MTTSDNNLPQRKSKRDRPADQTPPPPPPKASILKTILDKLKGDQHG